MFTIKFAGAAAALALLAAPVAASAHDGHSHGRHHQRTSVREVTGTATATVASFSDGDLVLSLPSGRTFDAAVTKKTVIDCRTAAPQAATARHGADDGPNHDAGDDRGRGNDDGAGHDANDDNGQSRGDTNGNGRCDSSALVAGARIAVAKLKLTGGDATWKKLVVVQ